MWSPSKKAIPTVLIVENQSGNVFIVENKKTKPQVEKILKSDSSTQRKALRSSRRKQSVKIEADERSPVIAL
jgi:hypothetical protein